MRFLCGSTVHAQMDSNMLPSAFNTSMLTPRTTPAVTPRTTPAVPQNTLISHLLKAMEECKFHPVEQAFKSADEWSRILVQHSTVPLSITDRYPATLPKEVDDLLQLECKQDEPRVDKVTTEDLQKLYRIKNASSPVTAHTQNVVSAYRKQRSKEYPLNMFAVTTPSTPSTSSEQPQPPQQPIEHKKKLIVGGGSSILQPPQPATSSSTSLQQLTTSVQQSPLQITREADWEVLLSTFSKHVGKEYISERWAEIMGDEHPEYLAAYVEWNSKRFTATPVSWQRHILSSIVQWRNGSGKWKKLQDALKARGCDLEFPPKTSNVLDRHYKPAWVIKVVPVLNRASSSQLDSETESESERTIISIPPTPLSQPSTAPSVPTRERATLDEMIAAAAAHAKEQLENIVSRSEYKESESEDERFCREFRPDIIRDISDTPSAPPVRPAAESERFCEESKSNVPPATPTAAANTVPVLLPSTPAAAAPEMPAHIPLTPIPQLTYIQYTEPLLPSQPDATAPVAPAATPPPQAERKQQVLLSTFSSHVGEEHEGRKWAEIIQKEHPDYYAEWIKQPGKHAGLWYEHILDNVRDDKRCRHVGLRDALKAKGLLLVFPQATYVRRIIKVVRIEEVACSSSDISPASLPMAAALAPAATPPQPATTDTEQLSRKRPAESEMEEEKRPEKAARVDDEPESPQQQLLCLLLRLLRGQQETPEETIQSCVLLFLCSKSELWQFLTTHKQELSQLPTNVRRALAKLLGDYDNINTRLTSSSEQQPCSACEMATMIAFLNDEPITGSVRTMKVEGETHTCWSRAAIIRDTRDDSLSLSAALKLLAEHHGLQLA